MFKKTICFLCLVLIGLCYGSIFVMAHTEKTDFLHDRKYTKWDIFEKDNPITYYYADGTTKTLTNTSHAIANDIRIQSINIDDFGNKSSILKNSIEIAISNWNSAKFNNIKFNVSSTTEDFDSENTAPKFCHVNIKVVNLDTERYWGQVQLQNKNENGNDGCTYLTSKSGRHLTDVTIYINAAKLSFKPASYYTYVIAHEIGHVMGLADLSCEFEDATYKDYLMGYSDWTTPGPTKQDIKGAAVALGLHGNDHKYTKYGVCDEDSTKHRSICSLCDGYKIEDHT